MSESASLRRCSLGVLSLVAACAHDVAPADMATSTAPPSEAELLAARPYTAMVPAGYTATQTWPLLLVLAGAGDDGNATASWLGFTRLAAAEGVFLVAPAPDPTHLPVQWNPAPLHAPNFDVEYLTAIIHDLERKYAIDRGQVFVAGHSLGAHLAQRIACDASREVAAIMSLAGQVATRPGDCAPSLPVSVVDLHGTADAIIGYDGDVQNVPPDPNVPSAHQTLAVWGRNDHCGALVATGMTYDLDTSLAGAETTVEAYADCPPLADADAGVAAPIGVELWTIHGGGHVPAVSGELASDVWTFLTAHARR